MADEIHPGDFASCAWCPDLCMDRCPVLRATGSLTTSPYGKMLLGWMLAEGRLAATHDLARAFYACTGCLSCHEACAYKVDVERALFDLRARLVQEGFTPYPLGLFEADDAALAAAQDAVVPKSLFVEGAQAVLFAGCAALLKAPDIVKDCLEVFERLDIRFVGASREAATCCGYPLYAGGYRSAFAGRAAGVARILNRYRTVVVLSPCCLYTLQNLYPLVGVQVRARLALASDLVAPLVLRAAAKPVHQTLAYHDSCFLGRHLGRYEGPREILAHIAEQPLLEFRKSRADAFCCGAGGAWDRTAPVQAKMAAAHVREAGRDAGGEIIVSACATCVAHLREGEGTNPRVMDLMSMVAEWMRGA